MSTNGGGPLLEVRDLKKYFPLKKGLFSRAETGELHGLCTVVGIYGDETCSAPLAKYADARRAS